MMLAVFQELQYEPSADIYLDILDHQSELFGVITGLAAVLAGEDSTRVKKAEQLGKHYYKYEQMLLDKEQYETAEHEPWNAWHLMSTETVIKYLRAYQSNIRTLCDELPTKQARLVCSLVALDIEAWITRCEDWQADQ
ncbi:hypothetical protein [Natrarchaeobius oligotrophus]|uniref:Uncharacterized protein n=1 Tax=Natrarchaeobius chitinivorans TaxID=1679083 RepID=A0A3N6M076_NATCH|nr:hypothetical protein [Natrarchaeobius chitinivorans]RQG94947.1 hypothetical protein EA472_22040 [Natrarchaeobius chitinivorans]